MNELWNFEQALRQKQFGLADDEFVLDNAPLKGIDELKQRRLAAMQRAQGMLPGAVPGQPMQPLALPQAQAQPQEATPRQAPMQSLAGIPDEAVDAYLASLSREQRQQFVGMTREEIVQRMEELANPGGQVA